MPLLRPTPYCLRFYFASVITISIATIGAMINDFKPENNSEKLLPASFEEQPKTIETDDSEVFETPEQIASREAAETLSAINVDLPESSASRKPITALKIKLSKWRKMKLSWPPHKKEFIVAGVLLVFIAGGIGGWLYFNNSSKKVAVVKPKTVVIKEIVAPVKVASALTGLLVDPSLNQVPVTGVMIENSLEARPQSGLSQAGVVFEAIAEGGITRFLALYQDTAPDNVGPIRSARPYYVQWAMGFDAGYAHIGGSPEAIANIKSWGTRDLDQFYNAAAYRRVSSRAAPHNVYAAITTLYELAIRKGYTTSTFTSFLRKTEAAASVPTAKSINLHISGTLYDVLYQYDATTNSYLRSEGGVPHADANTGTQLSPKVVIAMVIPRSLSSDGSHSVYGTIGSGPVYIFQDGLVSIGQWAKSANASQVIFTDSSNVGIKLNPGQTWITAISNTSDVTYSP